MFHTHDDASVASADNFSYSAPAAPYPPENYGSGPDGAVRPDGLDQADTNPSDFGCPIEDWKVD